MEIYLSESVIRKLIRQELCEVLEDKGIKTNTISDEKAAAEIKQSSNNLKNGAAGLLAATALTIALGLGQDESKAAIQSVEDSSNQAAMEVANKADEKIQELTKLGLKYDAAEQIVAGVIQGVNQQNKMPENIDSEEALYKQTEIYKLQSQELDKLNQNQVETILYVKFYKDMETKGRSTTASAIAREKKLGAVKYLDAISIGLGLEAQNSISEEEAKTFEAGKTPDGLAILTIDPMELDSYWKNLIVPESDLEVGLQSSFDEVGDLKIPYFHYQFAATEKMASDIEKQTMKENKILIIRGKYV